jgi:hypothetical protein
VDVTLNDRMITMWNSSLNSVRIAITRLTHALLALTLVGCSAIKRSDCPATEWLRSTTVAKRAVIADIRPKYLSLVDLSGLPEPAREGVFAWIDTEVARLESKIRTGDELWYFREEKCLGCGWYREGYALVRGCIVVDEATLSDEM